MAPVGGSLPEHTLSDRLVAVTTRLVGTLVYEQFLAEVPRLAVGADIVAQGSPTDTNGHRQHFFDRSNEFANFVA